LGWNAANKERELRKSDATSGKRRIKLKKLVAKVKRKNGDVVHLFLPLASTPSTLFFASSSFLHSSPLILLLQKFSDVIGYLVANRCTTRRVFDTIAPRRPVF